MAKIERRRNYLSFSPLIEHGPYGRTVHQDEFPREAADGFKHFKAELGRSLREVDPNVAERVSGKIDGAWADMLWKYRDEDHFTDRAFLRYFRFVCDILYYLNDDSPQGKTTD